MSLKTYPELDLEQEDEEEMYKYYYDETQEWKLEHEKLLEAIFEDFPKPRNDPNKNFLWFDWFEVEKWKEEKKKSVLGK